jgi:hypothetical protein
MSRKDSWGAHSVCGGVIAKTYNVLGVGSNDRTYFALITSIVGFVQITEARRLLYKDNLGPLLSPLVVPIPNCAILLDKKYIRGVRSCPSHGVAQGSSKDSDRVMINTCFYRLLTTSCASSCALAQCYPYYQQRPSKYSQSSTISPAVAV